MKVPLSISITTLLLALSTAFPAMAQKTKVYGNLGIENVNISVIHTPYGTTSDAKGRYELLLNKSNKPIDLHYSCIGYQDTIVSLTPRQLLRDSINISFRMQRRDYSLNEVGVTANRPTRLEGGTYFIMDFEMYDSVFCILEASHSRKQFRIIMADENLSGFDTIPIPSGISPERLQRDCLGNCQLIATDSVYQISLTDKPHSFIAAQRAYYFRTMQGCLFATDQHIYIKEESMQGYLVSFYRIDRFNKKPQMLFISNMSDHLQEYWNEMKFNAKNPIGFGCDAPLGVYSRYIKKYWFRPSDAELALTADTLVYFDHNNGIIYQYDLNLNKIDSCAINYPFMEGWKFTFYQDHARNHFYTVINDHLHEIDLKTGMVSAKTQLIPSLFNKVVIYNGHLFVLRRLNDSSTQLRTYIEKRNL